MTYDERSNELLKEKRPYYVYTEDSITLDSRKDVQKVLKLCKSAVTSGEYNSYCFDVMSEQYVLDALKSHPWRINAENGDVGDPLEGAGPDNTITNAHYNNNNMMIHIVTTPLIALLGVGCREAGGCPWVSTGGEPIDVGDARYAIFLLTGKGCRVGYIIPIIDGLLIAGLLNANDDVTELNLL